MHHTLNYIVLSLLLLSLAACGDTQTRTSGAAEAPVASSATGGETTVEVVNPQQRSFTAEVNLVGTSRPNQVVQLHAMESGFVKKLYKDIGDAVREGEVIAQLENPELLRLYQKQKALLEAKKSIYNRLHGIAEKTPALTTMAQVETAKADYESALAEYNSIADRISFLKVRSPFSGIITKRLVDKGNLVQSGISNPQATPLVEVMELQTIRLSVALPETDVSGVDVGTKATVLFPELTGETFEAQISRISRALNERAKTMQIEIDIPNKDHRIKPGMYARVSIRLSSRDQALSVPNTALVVHQNDFFVYVVENGVVQRVPVRKGLSNKDYFEILDAGITDASQVVVRGKNQIQPGMNVQPILTQQSL
jgi:RND family efflux transporter MFP subunit